jgi:2-polyprenyl-6-methoxyphenol hydroxylase-like FAD-dependent oxidoreductase
MASPNTGAGAYTAMLDAVALGETFAECKGDIDATLKAYNPKGVAQAQSLYNRSYQIRLYRTPKQYKPTKDLVKSTKK